MGGRALVYISYPIFPRVVMETTTCMLPKFHHHLPLLCRLARHKERREKQRHWKLNAKTFWPRRPRGAGRGGAMP